MQECVSKKTKKRSDQTMSYQGQRRNLLLGLFFALSYLVGDLINQTLLGHNPTVMLGLNLSLGGALGFVTLQAWRKYKKILSNIPREKISFITEPRTLFTVLGFFAFATIFSAINQYSNLGLSQIAQILFVGPFLLAVISGNIPFNIRRKKPDWRSG